MRNLEITAIPAFADNYIWLITAGEEACAVVDPGDAAPVRDALKRRGLKLKYILITHHHADHIGGVEQLKAETGAEVFGPHDPRITGQTRSYAEGDVVELAELDLSLRVLEVPGHTSTHIAFYGEGCLFCGDTLFSVGCGRLFEGTPEQMQVSLDKIQALPPETLVYCTHEYTLSNCEFASAVEPDNQALAQRTRDVIQARSAGDITLPTTIGAESEVNPFLRTREPSVLEAARRFQPEVLPGAPTFEVIRAWKDRF